MVNFSNKIITLLYDNRIIYRKEMINIIKKKLIVSEYYEEESFLFFRYLFSSFYGLLIRDFFIEDIYLVFNQNYYF